MKRNDLVLVDLPPPLGGAGREQTGRRPAVVMQDATSTLPTVVVLPITSQLAALRFPHTLSVDPSSENGLTMPSVILLFQIQVVDQRRIVRTIGQLEPNYVQQIDVELRRMLTL